MKPTSQDLEVVAFAATARPLDAIASTPAYLDAADRLLQLRRKLDYLGQRKAELQKPLKDVQAVVKEWFGPSEDRLQVEIDAVKDALCHYVEVRVPEAAAESWALKAAGANEAALVAMGAVPAVEGITLRDVPDFEPTGAEIPDEYYDYPPPVLNRKRVLAALKKGVVIPGIVRKHRVDLSVSLKGDK